ncbi:hypothetical protein IH781_02920 [Patescibacteria group bacterium]|nr:hypothetical protein [Patescibacteria group bacterium]
MAGREVHSQATVVLAEYQEREPAKVVEVNGQPYVWIYEVLNPEHFEQHVGEIVSGVEVGQTVRPVQDAWQTIDIGFATFSSRQNTATVVLHIRDTVEATEDLRTVTLKASELVDNEWQRFTFDPIPDSRGREFYVAITSPEAVAGQAVTVRFSNHDLKPGKMLLLRRELTAGERRADFFRSGDIAYRL